MLLPRKKAPKQRGTQNPKRLGNGKKGVTFKIYIDFHI